jgi:hypothetical protein
MNKLVGLLAAGLFAFGFLAFGPPLLPDTLLRIFVGIGAVYGAFRYKRRPGRG